MLENNVQMKILKNKVLVDAILLVIQFCNLFVGNIMVYETTENNMFDWRLLFHNKGFKIWAFVFIGYNILIFYSEKGKEESENIKKAYEKRMQEIRGNDIGMIFQDPMTFLNPILKVGTQIEEQILRHTKCSKKEARERAIELMKKVGIPSPEKRIDQYPFQFSGGMRQRIIIAIALSCNPKLIIADEPTTALDVTVQSQILELLQQIAEETGTAIIMITHDLGVVATLCQKINIMYGGQIVEHGTTDEIFYNPKHPYTMGLLRSIGTHTNGERQSLIPIPGTPPDLLKLNSGCAFMPRCSKAMKICKDYMPCRTQFSEDQYCSCWEYCKDSADKIVQEQSAAVNG
mgnify:CR=1 FL=1